eukprot:1138457-Pelagomonas_calceolata.AAC.6
MAEACGNHTLRPFGLSGAAAEGWVGRSTGYESPSRSGLQARPGEHVEEQARAGMLMQAAGLPAAGACQSAVHVMWWRVSNLRHTLADSCRMQA